MVQLLSDPKLVVADGVAVRAFQWDLDKVETYAKKFASVGVFSDDVPKDALGFLRYVTASGTLWFELMEEETERHLGFTYITDLQTSWTEPRYLFANWHGVVWDSHAGRCLPATRAFIKWVFRAFNIHKLTTSIPAKFGGAIRVAKKLGFIDEGRLRKARRYNGVWFDVILLSILESELGDG